MINILSCSCYILYNSTDTCASRPADKSLLYCNSLVGQPTIAGKTKFHDFDRIMSFFLFHLYFTS